MIHIYPGYDHVFQFLFIELENNDNIKVHHDIYRYKWMNEIWNKIERKRIIHRIIPFMSILFYPFINGINKIKDNDILIVSNIASKFFPKIKLNVLKKKKCHTVLYFIDSLSNINTRDAFRKASNYDLVYTFDKNDAKEHKFIYRATMYPKIKLHESEIIFDAEYIGSNKGRYDIILDIVRQCKGCNLYIDILGVDTNLTHEKGINYNVNLKYKDTLKLMIKSNCIIDVLKDKSQSGLSLRVYEAVVYNKKLLTNNSSVLSFPYYDPRYMRYVEDFNNLDVSFIKDRLKVDYGYKGEFSANNFIKDITLRLNDNKHE